MIGCYRKGDAADPEIYTRAIIVVLAGYPAGVVIAVTSPTSGLPSKSNFLPTVREVTQACDELLYLIKSRIDRQERIKTQLAEREQLEQERTKRLTLDELKAKYGDNWGLNPSDPKPDEKERLDAMARYTQRSIEQEWAALGKEPLTVNGLIISPALAKQLRGVP